MDVKPAKQGVISRKRRIWAGVLFAVFSCISLTCILPSLIPTPPPVVSVITPTLSTEADSLPTARPILPPSCRFDFNQGGLSVKTNSMELKIVGGAIIFIKDLVSGEILVDSDPFQDRPADAEFIGYSVSQIDGSITSKAPLSIAAVEFLPVADCQASLTYNGLGSDSKTSSGSLLIEVTIDAARGDVILQAAGVETEPNAQPRSINIPIMRATTPAVILGSGALYARQEARASDKTTHVDYGLYAPTVAVLQGQNSVVAVWSETTRFAPEYIRLEHRPQYDHLILHAKQDPASTEQQAIKSPPWRISTYPSWEQAAKGWRAQFEASTGARPLWENRSTWVQNIHAVIDATYQDYGADPNTYAQFASLTPPSKTLFFLWNGDRIVLYGDPTLVDVIARPSPQFLQAVELYGWPLILYHPYTIIRSRPGTVQRLDFLAKQGWLPANYQFKPTYNGQPEDWHAYWEDISTNYEDGSKMSILHPGAVKFRNYFINNLDDYLSQYHASGAYLDIQGADQDDDFPPEKKVVDGLSYVLGEITLMDETARQLPHYGMMSEYQSPWLLPYIFFSWEGGETHSQRNILAQTRLNHPLRVALTGSYAWTRESTAFYDPIASALMGSLPQVSIDGDQGVDSSKANWSQERAKLFCDEELFNDLPEKWDVDALAYYRSMKTGRWFKFMLIDQGYGYVEILSDGTEVTRLAR